MNLYYCRIDEFQDMAGFSLLPPDRQQQIERYRRAEDKIRSLVAGLLLRMALGEKCFQMEKNPQGKLYLPEGPYFNLSHSGEYVLLGVSDYENGVDIEKIETVNERVAQRSFTKEEVNWLNEQKESDAFYQLWTAKESIMKATGLGFALPMQSFSVLPVSDGRHPICEKDWFMNWRKLPGYAICTACAGEETLNMIEIKREQLLK